MHSTVSSIIFATTLILSILSFSRPALKAKLLFRPYLVAQGKSIYSLISSGFIHADWMHLLFNMMTFYFFCFDLEGTIGSASFALIYFFSMIVAHLPSLFSHRNNPYYSSLGASGAISGALFASIILHPAGKMLIFPIPFPLPAPIFGFLYLGYCWYAARNSNDNINHGAHFWGAITGLILIAILLPNSFSAFFSYVFN